jgi:error-prone DNA polymerase
MFITLEDETIIANLVVWPKIFEKHRRIILGAGMFSVRGRIQREGKVVHLVAHYLRTCPRSLPALVSGMRPSRFPTAAVTNSMQAARPDPRGLPPRGFPTRDIFIPDLHIDRLRVNPRDFR